MDQLTKTATSKRGLFLSTYRQQEWSLPDNIIYYITKYPSSPKCYEKMVQTCKHFFIKNPILIVPEFYLEYIIYKKYPWNARFDGRRVDINKITSKIWVTYRIRIYNDKPVESHILSPIIPKIYKSDITDFCLYNQDIYFDHLKFLASECKEMECIFSIVMTESGSVIPLKKILEVFSKVKDFEYNCGYDGYRSSKIISSKTVSELLKISNFSKLVRFTLYGIPEIFDIETFYDYIKQNKNTSIRLDFCEGLSDAYKSRLQTIVNEIIDDENREYNPPFIYFPGMTESSNDKMWELRNPNFLSL